MAYELEGFLLAVTVQLAVIIGMARVGGWLFTRFGQPLVVGEIAVGLLLGPSGLGGLSPQFSSVVFSEEVKPVFEVLGHLGLMFLMFNVGLEFEFGHLRRQHAAAAGIALGGIVFPFGMGFALAWVMHPHVAATYNFTGFALFMATAMSITAIPILGRILMEFGIQRTRTGVLTITAAAVDDALGWILLAAVSAVVVGDFQFLTVTRMIGMTLLFVAVTTFLLRPLLVKSIPRFLAGGDPFSLVPLSLAMILVLASGAVTSQIGIFSIFGPLVVGAALSDQDTFRRTVLPKFSSFVAAFFLPVFFTYTGLKTNVNLLSSGILWLFCVLVTVVACAGKLLGCGLAARAGGLTWRESACVAVLMNTRALMGLVAINIGRELGIIPDSVFCMLVIMALATTFLTSPVLRRLARGGAL